VTTDNPIVISGLDAQGARITSKDFEELVRQAAGEHRLLQLKTFGQHNVGCRLRRDDGLTIEVQGPAGQRLGCMGMPGTTIVCHGSASDDVGYLNIGADVIVRGDATNGVCNAMAQGRVMIGGSIGARGLTMTKWNPEYTRPELWVLGSVGDTFAEFNCGGMAVVCGVDAMRPDNVLGYRPCVGMVGGWIYFRGQTDNTYARNSAREALPNDEQWQWLLDRLPEFLERVGRPELVAELSRREEWKMLMSVSPQERALMLSGPMPMQEFRHRYWNKAFNGGDPLSDLAPGLDRSPIPAIVSGDLRRRRPFWLNRSCAAPCTYYCPIHIPTVDRLRLIREGRYDEAYELVLHYTPFPASVCGAICPNLCMENCSRQRVDESIDQRLLGQAIRNVAPPQAKPAVGRKVAIIGAGPSGMNAAWQLALAGIEAHLFERDDKIGGKVAQVIPWERLSKAIWDSEVERFLNMPNISVNLSVEMTKEKFAQLRDEYEYVVVAVGTHTPRRLQFPGHERVTPALDFLKAGKSDTPPPVGKRVVVIGAGNVGCDVACEAYRLGAEQVTLVDIQKPLAFGKEKEAAEALGAQFRWPVITREVTAEGLVTRDGELIPADTVLISIGDIPALSFLPETVETVTVGGAAWVKTDPVGVTSDPKVLAVGDVQRPGLATNALGAGKRAAEFIVAALTGVPWQPFKQEVITPKAIHVTHYSPESGKGDSQEAQANRCLSCGSCRDCHLCETICPTGAISRHELPEGEGVGYEYVSDNSKCIACGFCSDTCPCGIWAMKPF